VKILLSKWRGIFLLKKRILFMMNESSNILGRRIIINAVEF